MEKGLRFTYALESHLSLRSGLPLKKGDSGGFRVSQGPDSECPVAHGLHRMSGPSANGWPARSRLNYLGQMRRGGSPGEGMKTYA